MTRRFSAFAGLVALVLLSGCSTHRMAEKTRLPSHPIHETRMTNQPAPGYVPTGVWRVAGISNTVYLAGTCHVVADDEIPFPSSYYAAYRDAKEVWVEADPLSFSGKWLVVSAVPGAVSFLLKHMPEFYCPKGKTLEDYISPDTARQLREHFGTNYPAKKILTPLGLVFFSDFDGANGSGEGGVDDLFALLAHRDFKPIHSLDDGATAQLIKPALNAALNFAKQEIATRGADMVVRESTIEENQRQKDWRYGDVKEAEKELAQMKREAREVFDQLLPERNRRWLVTIKRALAGKRNVMVLVGALHLVGDEGLIEMLRREGFKPEQMYGIDRPIR